jgi:hypothetical protein
MDDGDVEQLNFFKFFSRSHVFGCLQVTAGVEDLSAFAQHVIALVFFSANDFSVFFLCMTDSEISYCCVAGRLRDIFGRKGAEE